MKRSAGFLISYLLFILNLGAQSGETIFLVEPSSQTRFPPPRQELTNGSSSVQARRNLIVQTTLPSGWHLQVPLMNMSEEQASQAAEKLRPLLGETSIFLIRLGDSYRVSAGPLTPSQLQPTLQRIRQAGFSSAVLRHFSSSP